MIQTSVPSGEAPDVIVPLLLERKASKARGRPVIAAVAGGSGDGKGYLIGRLAERLRAAPGMPKNAVSVLSLDNYYVGVGRMRAAGVPHFDHPDALDLALAAEHIAKARVGRTLKIPTYDFGTGERVGEEDFTARAFVLVDGLFALRHPDILAAADLKIFVRSDHDSSMLRRLFRDAGPEGRTKQSSREVLEQYFTTVWPAKREFIDPTVEHADVIVESRYEPSKEAHRAGSMQYQLKARAKTLSDEAVRHLAKATRLGATLQQIDRFMVPKDRAHADEILRLRLEPAEADEVLLTYKGPFLPRGRGEPGARPVTSPIALPRDAMRWFSDAYRAEATLKKTRVLYQSGGALIARDMVEGLGNFIEVRADNAVDARNLERLLAKLCPGEPQTHRSYLDLWRTRGAPSSATL